MSTEQEYAAVIPTWCSYRTLQEHIDMMLCWSLVGYVERGEPKPKKTCEDCDLYATPSATERGAS